MYIYIYIESRRICWFINPLALLLKGNQFSCISAPQREPCYITDLVFELSLLILRGCSPLIQLAMMQVITHSFMGSQLLN